MSTFPTLDISKPDATTQSLSAMGASMRDQQTYLRACIVSGTLAGYNGALSGGTATQPAQCLYSKGAEQIKEAYTWGSVGGAINNVQSIDYTYSSDTGSTWATVGTLTYTFDASGNVTSWAWS